MELPLKCVPSRYEVHAVIHFFMAENLSASATQKWLQNVYDVDVMFEGTVWLWVHSFHKGKWENIHDDERSDRLHDTSTDEMIRAVLTIFKCDEKFSICEGWDLLVLKHSTKVSHMNVQHVLDLEGHTNVCARGNKYESTQPGNFWCSTQTILRRFCRLSHTMNFGFFTTPRHGKKTLEFGIKRTNKHQKNLVFSTGPKKFSTLSFGIVEA